MFDKIMGFVRSKLPAGKRQKAEDARQDLMSNAQKALRMKEEAQSGSTIPPHKTANEGMRLNETQEDHIPAKEGYFQPELKRTKVARSGDAS